MLETGQSSDIFREGSRRFVEILFEGADSGSIVVQRNHETPLVLVGHYLTQAGGIMMRRIVLLVVLALMCVPRMQALEDKKLGIGVVIDRKSVV